jgi:hypothetical protein
VVGGQPCKKLVRAISTNKLDMMVCTYHPSYMEGKGGGKGIVSRRVMFQASPGKSERPFLKHN